MRGPATPAGHEIPRQTPLSALFGVLACAPVTAPKICLCMIVRDEAGVIERCLGEVRAHVDAWCVVDTGSVDDTVQRVRSAMSGLPGEVFERPWVDFGHNRSEALALCREHFGATCDYALMLDADDVLRAEGGLALPAGDAPGYMLDVRLGDGSFTFKRVHLMRLDLPWRYVGVLHEYPMIEGEAAAHDRLPALEGPEIRTYNDGARNQKGREKYAADAKLLESALQREPDNARYQFYLAQCLRDAGETDRAIAAYHRRCELGGWAEELWFAKWQVAKLRAERGDTWPEVLAALLAAYESRPTRAEPLVALAGIARQRKDWNLAYLFAQKAMHISPPADLLFVDEAAHAWRPLDEASIAAHYLGNYDEALRLADLALADTRIPAAQRERILENRRYSLRALGQMPAGPLPPTS